MSITQISLFVESKPGHLTQALEVFSEHGINVCGFSASDTGEYGIVRFIVDRPDEAYSLLQERGAAVRKSEVLCVRLEDRPGELESVLVTIAEREINVAYCYSIMGTGIVFAVSEREAAEAALEQTELHLVGQDEIASL